ncbi:hypothetical protein JHK82_045021 [Glycine max]|nr:hypothetical protein JHK86_045439 [Glycine max]KAG4952152.1 hypothetical protein JHK85_046019 [Glycine max]KAG5099969.1 hypothetical protein JHK82_045021 [Glycine max]
MAVEKQLLSASDRFGILDDSFALCMARQESLTSLINLMGSYREEVNYTVLSNLMTTSLKVQRIAADAIPDFLEYFMQFFINLFQYSAERLGRVHHGCPLTKYRNTRVDEAQPVPAMVEVEAVASEVVVVDVAAGVDVDDEQSKAESQ